ncbi:Gfo/Idh/MocA family protein [Microlunatus sp. Gsoil 973]|uniref:Gfo/Idh/MocA family protein n=1 Tax=Microlunatus sp. Gsoil 973 TaxID=2672569 RepID=UPI0018A7F941|nr:Gfo/Idh/MocA family oxidoreductase [Microlunatus sp. Gsoil 973]
MADSDRPVIGIVGGGIRGSMYAAAVRQHPAADLAGICESDTGRADRLSQEFSVPVHADLGSMIADLPELTALVVATPDFAHREVALLGIEHGLDLMIEKPLATSGEDARAIVAAAESVGRMIMVGFENRWNPRFVRIRQDLAEAGSPMVNQVINLNDTSYVPTGMLGWAARSSPGWFLMPHTLDLACWLSGARPTEVYARGRRGFLDARRVPTWDAITATFGMSDGSLLVLNSQWVLPQSYPAVFDFRYELHTETASYQIDVADSGVTRYDGDGISRPQFGVIEQPKLSGVPIDMINSFIDRLNGADLDLPDGRHGELITLAIEAVHTSISEGRPITIR